MPDPDLIARVKEMLVESLMLRVQPGEIGDETPLFSPEGLALDSIDALELALEISKRYGVQLKADDEDNKRIFASLRSLSDFVQSRRAAAC